MDQDLLQLLHNCILSPKMKISMMHSHEVSPRAYIGQGLVIWSYEDAQKSLIPIGQAKMVLASQTSLLTRNLEYFWWSNGSMK